MYFTTAYDPSPNSTKVSRPSQISSNLEATKSIFRIAGWLGNLTDACQIHLIILKTILARSRLDVRKPANSPIVKRTPDIAMMTSCDTSALWTDTARYL